MNTGNCVQASIAMDCNFEIGQNAITVIIQRLWLLFFTVHWLPTIGGQPTSCQAPRHTLGGIRSSDCFFSLVIKVNRDMPQSFPLPLFSRVWSHAWRNGLRANTLCARNHIFNRFKWPTRDSCYAFQVVCEAGENGACFRFFPKLQLASSPTCY